MNLSKSQVTQPFSGRFSASLSRALLTALDLGLLYIRRYNHGRPETMYPKKCKLRELRMAGSLVDAPGAASESPTINHYQRQTRLAKREGGEGLGANSVPPRSARKSGRRPSCRKHVAEHSNAPWVTVCNMPVNIQLFEACCRCPNQYKELLGVHTDVHTLLLHENHLQRIDRWHAC